MIRARPGNDFPGFGSSPDQGDEPSLPALSRTLGEFVTALDLDNVTVVAHDLGGLTALGWAATESKRVRAFVMANTFVWTPHGAGLRLMLRLMSSRLITAFGAATNIVPRLTATWFGVGRHLDDRERAAFLGPFEDRARRRRFHRLMRSALDDTTNTTLVDAAITAELNDRPILTIFGERNDMFGFQRGHEARFPNHESLIIERGNHFPMMDDPDLFASTVANWWDLEVTNTR
jgi:haloalkane dehalogenase